MKSARILIMLMGIILPAVLIISGCSAKPSEEEKDKEKIITFTDSLDRQVEVSSYEKTAVASGSLAEIWQLAGGELYGVTNDAFDGHTLELSDDVVNYGDVKNPSVENMIADGVDFVILSGSISNQLKLVDSFEAAGITAAYFDVEDFDDYLFALEICTQITGREDLYEKNGEEVKERADAVIERCKEKEGPEILLLRAYSSGIKAKDSDNMTGKMLAQLGCVNIADSEASLLEELSLEAIVLADPDYIFITTMGGDVDAAVAA